MALVFFCVQPNTPQKFAPKKTMPFAVKQYTITLPAAKRGCHLITRLVRDGAPGLASCRAGLAHVFIQHTSASLTVNENADPDVRVDMETFLNLTVPEGPTAPWIHTDEGELWGEENAGGWISDRLILTSTNTHDNRPRRHAGPLQSVVDGQFGDAARVAGAVCDGHVARPVSERAPGPGHAAVAGDYHYGRV